MVARTFSLHNVQGHARSTLSASCSHSKGWRHAAPSLSAIAAVLFHYLRSTLSPRHLAGHARCCEASLADAVLLAILRQMTSTMSWVWMLTLTFTRLDMTWWEDAQCKVVGLLQLMIQRHVIRRQFGSPDYGSEHLRTRRALGTSSPGLARRLYLKPLAAILQQLVLHKP